MEEKIATVKLPSGIKAIHYHDEEMTGDYLVIEFENGLHLGVDALGLADDECQAVVYSQWKPDEGNVDVIAAIQFGENKPVPVVYNDAWRAHQQRKAES